MAVPTVVVLTDIELPTTVSDEESPTSELLAGHVADNDKGLFWHTVRSVLPVSVGPDAGESETENGVLTLGE